MYEMFDLHLIIAPDCFRIERRLYTFYLKMKQLSTIKKSIVNRLPLHPLLKKLINDQRD